MNPHIQELALESGAWHQVYGNRNFMIDEHFDIEKFARLIVQECCDIADEVEQADMDSYVSKYIRAHFGVEE